MSALFCRAPWCAVTLFAPSAQDECLRFHCTSVVLSWLLPSGCPRRDSRHRRAVLQVDAGGCVTGLLVVPNAATATGKCIVHDTLDSLVVLLHLVGEGGENVRFHKDDFKGARSALRTCGLAGCLQYLTCFAVLQLPFSVWFPAYMPGTVSVQPCDGFLATWSFVHVDGQFAVDVVM